MIRQCSKCNTFCMGLISRKIFGFLLYLLYITQCHISFSCINHLLHLYAWILILFHLTYMRFSQSTPLLICLSLETSMSIVRTNPFWWNWFLLRWLTFLLRSLTMTVKVQLFWISFFHLMLVFALQCNSVLNKGKYAIHPLFSGLEVLS